MTADAENLIWIDLEMTGLYPERDHILEIATVVPQNLVCCRTGGGQIGAPDYFLQVLEGRK